MNKLMAMCQTWWRRAKSDCDPANGNAFAQGRGQGESTCAAELTAVLPDVERLIEALRDANDECRSAASIAQRDGAQQVAPCPTCGVTGQNTPCHHHIYDPRG